jgi:hypothetical protein
MRAARIAAGLFAAVSLLFPPLLTALDKEKSPADPDKAVNKEQIDAALKLTKESAEKYKFVLDQFPDNEAKLVAEPILKWSNPAAGEIHGNVFLWTVHGRPAVVGSLYKWFSPHTHMSHEFHSFSESPLKGRFNDAEVWSPRAGGLKFAPLPEAPKVAASAMQRVGQMRRLAKDFVATKKERDGNQQELRLLPQPIYRYSSPEQKVVDGGLFVFVQGTDPEVFLLLEARGEGDAAAWQFAATRMNSVEFHLRYQDHKVWSAEIMPWRDVGSHAEPYTTFMFKMPPP